MEKEPDLQSMSRLGSFHCKIQKVRESKGFAMK